MKDWKVKFVNFIERNQFLKGILYGLLGGGIGLFILFLISKNTTLYGNVADWVSGIGSILAILFIYIQIKQDKIQYDDSHKPVLEIHVSERNMVEKIGEITHVTEVIELAIYGTNTGKVTGIYKYMGMCDLVDYNEAIRSGNDMDYLKKQHKLKDINPMYDIQAAERPFEKVVPFGVTSTFAFPIKTIRQNFPSRDMRLCIVFVDASMNPVNTNFKFDF